MTQNERYTQTGSRKSKIATGKWMVGTS